MRSRSFIEGVGLVSAQGVDAAATFDALRAGAVLTGHQLCPLPRDGQDRVTQLSVHAAREAIAEAGWGLKQLHDDRTALVMGTSKGPIERWIGQIEGTSPVRPILGVSETADDVAAALGVRGPRHTLAAACASGLCALIRADLMLRAGQCDRAIVIGAESSLHPLFVAAFARMGVLSRSGACRPFDERRDGFLLSEAAAAVCLERREGQGIRLDGGMMLSDAHHLTGIDPSGDSIRRLLAHLEADRAVDLVHAHGTATAANDPVELAAIDSLVSPSAAVYSHKAALGHTQGAAGMIGTVLNVLSHRRSVVLPNSNTPSPLPADRLWLPAMPVERTVGRSLVLAAGFGGPVAGIALRQC